jgi:hypothetical protein
MNGPLKSPHRARGRWPWEALQNMTRELYAHRDDPGAPHRAGEFVVRVVDVSQIDPNCGWIAEATWVPSPRG